MTAKPGRRNEFPSPIPPSFTNTVDDDARVTGGNAIVRWSRQLDEETHWSAQVYYDNTYRHWLVTGVREIRDTVDFDFQHNFQLGDRHAIIWGFGYRNTRGAVQGNPYSVDFSRDARAVDLFGVFLQDKITLLEDRWYFTLGSKFEYNDFTQFEIQPTARFLWTPTDRHSIWTSVSRAVRLPTQAENDMRILLPPVAIVPNPAPPPAGIPVYPLVIGNERMDAEELMAYEAGIRVQPTDSFSWDLAAFYYDYDRLRSVPFASVPVPGFPPILPGVIGNAKQASHYGFELTLNLDLTEHWHMYSAYSFLATAGDTDMDAADPRNKLYIQSAWEFATNWELDLIWRYVDNASLIDPRGESVSVSNYNVFDVRLAWHVRPEMELSLVGRNLFDPAHFEYPGDIFLGNATTEVQSEVYGMVTWRR